MFNKIYIILIACLTIASGVVYPFSFENNKNNSCLAVKSRLLNRPNWFIEEGPLLWLGSRLAEVANSGKEIGQEEICAQARILLKEQLDKSFITSVALELPLAQTICDIAADYISVPLEVNGRVVELMLFEPKERLVVFEAIRAQLYEGKIRVVAVTDDNFIIVEKTTVGGLRTLLHTVYNDIGSLMMLVDALDMLDIKYESPVGYSNLKDQAQELIEVCKAKIRENKVLDGLEVINSERGILESYCQMISAIVLQIEDDSQEVVATLMKTNTKLSELLQQYALLYEEVDRQAQIVEVVLEYDRGFHEKQISRIAMGAVHSKEEDLTRDLLNLLKNPELAVWGETLTPWVYYELLAYSRGSYPEDAGKYFNPILVKLRKMVVYAGLAELGINHDSNIGEFLLNLSEKDPMTVEFFTMLDEANVDSDDYQVIVNFVDKTYEWWGKAAMSAARLGFKRDGNHEVSLVDDYGCRFFCDNLQIKLDQNDLENIELQGRLMSCGFGYHAAWMQDANVAVKEYFYAITGQPYNMSNAMAAAQGNLGGVDAEDHHYQRMLIHVGFELAVLQSAKYIDNGKQLAEEIKLSLNNLGIPVEISLDFESARAVRVGLPRLWRKPMVFLAGPGSEEEIDFGV